MQLSLNMRQCVNELNQREQSCVSEWAQKAIHRHYNISCTVWLNHAKSHANLQLLLILVPRKLLCTHDRIEEEKTSPSPGFLSFHLCWPWWLIWVAPCLVTAKASWSLRKTVRATDSEILTFNRGKTTSIVTAGEKKAQISLPNTNKRIIQTTVYSTWSLNIIL